MPQFAVLIYEKPIAFEDIPPEVMEGHEQVPEKIEQAGGKFAAGFAAAPAADALTIRGGETTKGPFQDGPQQLAGFFVIEASDLNHAAELAAFVPIIDGGVEVRPLLEIPEDE